ncbi:hypothetical protein AX15_007329 [Amanita polypyramis BW_CC]|nr:hypothetical protein AX15_007329 [Amanita polypyramis BW_CC]
MFSFATVDVAFGLRHNIEAFVYFEGEATQYFEDISSWVNVMKMICYVGQTFVGDAILLYRCWVVYNRRWLVVIIQIIMWLGETACGIMAAYGEATLHHGGSAGLKTNDLLPWITSLLTLTLATNVITTSLIVYKICVMRVLIESGTFYTASVVLLFVVYMSSSNAELPVSDAIVQIIGITFNVIIVRGDRDESRQRNTTKGSDLPLHIINVQTSITQRHDDALELTDSHKGAEKACKLYPQ